MWFGKVKGGGGEGKMQYRIFALLSACAYIPTGRKHALNNDVHLISRCALIGIYSVCTALIEQVLMTRSECVLIREDVLCTRYALNNAKIR